jgi:gamma-glutamylcyclotransferase (GGCT)/AIG2-like uncharacterized protein YtfP
LGTDGSGQLVFAYGTLIFPDVMRAVTGRSFSSVPAVLQGYRRWRIEARTYPGIVAAQDHATDGCLYRGVDDGSLARLDVFEGELYERRRLRVTREGEAIVEAWSYVVAAHHEHRVSLQMWDAEDFLLEHGEAFIEACRRFRKDGVA